MNTLMLALMTIRDLPPKQREIWDDVFRHYVYAASDEKAWALRARLLQRLNR